MAWATSNAVTLKPQFYHQTESETWNFLIRETTHFLWTTPLWWKQDAINQANFNLQSTITAIKGRSSCRQGESHSSVTKKGAVCRCYRSADFVQVQRCGRWNIDKTGDRGSRMYPEWHVVLYLKAIQNIKVIQIYEITEIPMNETHFFERFDNRCFAVFNIQLIPMYT